MKDAAELIELLRNCEAEDSPHYANAHMRQAADRLASAEARVATLSKALEEIAKPIEQFPSSIWTKIGLIKIIESFQRAAREASR